MVQRPSFARAAFISYHRQASHGHAQTFYRALAQVLGERRVFMDVGQDAIPLGDDWRTAVAESLRRTDLLLLLVDTGLADRLENPSDSVRFEIEAAIEHGVRIVAVRVDGAGPLGAGELPTALRFLADANTPAVRPDSSIDDVNAIVKRLTGHSPTEIRAADRWDALVIAGILAVGALAWVSFGRGMLNLGDTWLWGSLLLIPILLWWFGRRALHFPVSSTGPSRAAYAGSRSLLVLVLGTTWAIGASRLYRVPAFSGEGGILVGRFDHDPSDRFQHEFARLLREQAARYAPVAPALTVAELPRRIGDEESARRYAVRSGASVVLWGVLEADASPRDSIEAIVRVLFVDRPGMFQGAVGVERSASGRSEFAGPERLELHEDLGVFKDVLPGLLAGYHLYLHAASPSEIDFAGQFLSGTLLRAEDNPESPALEDALAMLHFLRGNVRVLAGEPDSAAADYADAIHHSSLVLLADHGSIPTYVEPINNLAYVQIDNGNLDGALTTLERSDQVCTGGSVRPAACASVAYQKADVLSERGEFAKAAEALDHVINTSANETDRRLLAYAHQLRAYGAVRQASRMDRSSAAALLQRAGEDAGTAEEVLTGVGQSRPGKWAVTIARISIEKGLWQEALDTLRWVMDQHPEDVEAKALGAAAKKCLNQVDDEYTDWAATIFMQSTHDLTMLSEEYNRITHDCSPEGG